MQKNLYFRNVYRRRNIVKEFCSGVVYMLASPFRLILEVFIRRNFGERYFSFSEAVLFLFFLCIWPFMWMNLEIAVMRMGGGWRAPSFEWDEYWSRYWDWYVFIGLCLLVCWRRHLEVRRNPSVFDFARFSLYSGDVGARFLGFKLSGKTMSIREVEILIEPAFFLAIGVVLAFVGRGVGWLIAFSAIMYSISYVGAYHKADNFVMDKIDEIICNEELEVAFVEGLDASQTRGVRPMGRRPADPDLRRRVADTFMEGEEEDDDEQAVR
jgi:hypothetical protein